MLRLLPSILVSATACASAALPAAPGNGDDDDDTPPLVDAPPIFFDAPSPDGARPAEVCASSATCPVAIDLGRVSGDTDHQIVTATGHQSAWYRVRVTENDSSIDGVSLRVAAHITSPPGVDYDVFVYIADDDEVECDQVVGSATGTATRTRLEWGEGLVSNGSSDARPVSVEVRPVSGACTAASPWTLEIEGNW